MVRHEKRAFVVRAFSIELKLVSDERISTRTVKFKLLALAANFHSITPWVSSSSFFLVPEEEESYSIIDTETSYSTKNLSVVVVEYAHDIDTKRY